MKVNSLSSYLGSSVRRKILEQKFIFQIGTLKPHGMNERFSFDLLIRVFSSQYSHQ